MITWWIGLQFVTKAYFITITFIVGWCVGLQHIQVKCYGDNWR